MAKRLNETIIEVIEELTSCTVNVYDDYYSIYVDNRCGCDFEFEIQKGDNEIEEIIEYCENYDSSEEFKVWYGANRGEPSDPRVLMNNCDQIGDHLTELEELLKNFDFETFEKINAENQSLTIKEVCEIVEKGYSEVNAIWKDKNDLAHEEIKNLVSNSSMLEPYFDYESFADDLLGNSDRYFELSSGRIVGVN